MISWTVLACRRLVEGCIRVVWMLGETIVEAAFACIWKVLIMIGLCCR